MVVVGSYRGRVSSRTEKSDIFSLLLPASCPFLKSSLHQSSTGVDWSLVVSCLTPPPSRPSPCLSIAVMITVFVRAHAPVIPFGNTFLGSDETVLYEFFVDASNAVIYLKQVAETASGHAFDKQRLSFGGHFALNNEQTLASYGIIDGSTVDLYQGGGVGWGVWGAAGPSPAVTLHSHAAFPFVSAAPAAAPVPAPPAAAASPFVSAAFAAPPLPAAAPGALVAAAAPLVVPPALIISQIHDQIAPPPLYSPPFDSSDYFDFDGDVLPSLATSESEEEAFFDPNAE